MRKTNKLIFNQKAALDENSLKLEEIVQFYLDNKNKQAIGDTATDFLHHSIAGFRSNESSNLDSSQNSSELSGSMTETDDSIDEEDVETTGPKRKRKESKSDKASLPSTKRSK